MRNFKREQLAVVEDFWKDYTGDIDKKYFFTIADLITRNIAECYLDDEEVAAEIAKEQITCALAGAITLSALYRDEGDTLGLIPWERVKLYVNRIF